MNILLNAVQAYEDGGLIVLNGGVDKKHVWVSIGDHGCGIPPDLINKYLILFIRQAAWFWYRFRLGNVSKND